MLFIMREIDSVLTAIDIVMCLCWLAAGRIRMELTYTNCCLYRVDPTDDEQQACSKHVETYYWNELRENSAPCWVILYRYITIHGYHHHGSTGLGGLWTPLRFRNNVLFIRDRVVSLKLNPQQSWRTDVFLLEVFSLSRPALIKASGTLFAPLHMLDI